MHGFHYIAHVIDIIYGGNLEFIIDTANNDYRSANELIILTAYPP